MGLRRGRGRGGQGGGGGTLQLACSRIATLAPPRDSLRVRHLEHVRRRRGVVFRRCASHAASKAVFLQSIALIHTIRYDTDTQEMPSNHGAGKRMKELRSDESLGSKCHLSVLWGGLPTTSHFSAHTPAAPPAYAHRAAPRAAITSDQRALAADFHTHQARLAGRILQ